MKRRHDGKVAVITGAAAGFGRAYAVRLAAEGAEVAVVDRDAADEVLHEINVAGGKALALRCDVTVPGDVAKLGTDVEREFGRCDILVNNAGIFPSCRFEELAFEEWRRVLTTNLDSVFLMAKRFVPGMRARRWGRVINMASNTFAQVIPGQTHYISSKAGVIGFTRALASEVGGDGVTVNAIAPGFTRTPGSLARGPNYSGLTPEQMFEVLARRQAIPRPPTTIDLVGTLSFLASSDAEFMTGQTLYVDGGLVRSA